MTVTTAWGLQKYFDCDVRCKSSVQIEKQLRHVSTGEADFWEVTEPVAH